MRPESVPTKVKTNKLNYYHDELLYCTYLHNYLSNIFISVVHFTLTIFIKLGAQESGGDWDKKRSWSFRVHRPIPISANGPRIPPNYQIYGKCQALPL